MRHTEVAISCQGGSEPGETLEQTRVRAVREECGCTIYIGDCLGGAIEYVYAAS